MGFRKDRAIRQIRVPMLYKITNEDEGTYEEVRVAHVFEYPSGPQRERFDKDSVQVKGRKVRPSVSIANWNLWKQTILFVEGYDDLPPTKEQNRELLVKYFNDDSVRIHVDDAMTRMWDLVKAEDDEWEKKSEASSEESSGAQQRSIPLSETA